jgi:hypothetical protein
LRSLLIEDTNELASPDFRQIHEDVGTHLQVRHPDLLVDLHERVTFNVALGCTIIPRLSQVRIQEGRRKD